MYIADLHIHSKYSRATSRDCDAPHLDLWAAQKGITLVGTGDFTHPAWRKELKEAFVPAEEGLYVLRKDLRLPAEVAGQREAPRFVVTGEISSIYKKNGKTRKVHNVILLPGLEEAECLSRRLEAIGNIHSDGRPILGLDSRDLLEITLETCPEAVFIPAHIWTPHFSRFGAFSGFDTIEECFEDLTGEVHALETGLSSDPPMNWQVSALDRFTLVSNSDAHSPAKLGREANLLDTGLSYSEMARAIQTGEGFGGTIEFFPEEGKYHLDGHRNCQVRLEPQETVALGGKCPVCGKKITIGVQHRVWELTDRPEGKAPGRKPFQSLAPLPEVIAAATGLSAASRRTAEQYHALLAQLGTEFTILRETPVEDIERAAGPCVAEGVRRIREGRVERIAGYDGEYGKIALLTPEEREAMTGQLSLFGAPAERGIRKKAALPEKRAAQVKQGGREEIAARTDELNEEQLAAVTTGAETVAVIAGPGTGKTKTLVARIAHLIGERGMKPSQITAVTFTNQAAAEMRERLEARLGGKKNLRGMTIGTFHAICLGLLDKKPLLGENESLFLIRDILREQGSRASPRETLRRISRVKSGEALEAADLDPEVYRAYCARCREMGVRDLDDLLLDALELPGGRGRMFDCLLVDEFQDINLVQRKLVRHWAKGSLFVIGDPDQSIYGFRGANARCFEELAEDFPRLTAITLRKNYRSTPQIVEGALGVISHNTGGERKLLPTRGAGGNVRLAAHATPFSEGVWIAKEIARMAGGIDMLDASALGAERGSRSFSEIAVLCRTRRQLELVESCLRHDSIPCVVSGRGEELEDEGVRGALAFFRLLLSPLDRAALADWLGLVWGCGREQIGRACALLEEGREMREALSMSGCPPQSLADWDTFLPLAAKEKPQRLLERYIALHGGDDAMQRLLNTSLFHSSLADFLAALTLGAEGDLRRASGRSYASGAVRLMTLHGSKGLEFPVVFLAGLSAGALPLERPGMTADREEERRLFFVGMTRAREELILTAPQPPSDFLRELPAGVERIQVKMPRGGERSVQLSLF